MEKRGLSERDATPWAVTNPSKPTNLCAKSINKPGENTTFKPEN